MMARIRAVIHCMRQRGVWRSRIDAALQELKRSAERETYSAERVKQKRDQEREQTEHFRDSMDEMIRRMEGSGTG